MSKCELFADFNTGVGVIKPMHCGNGGPRVGGRTLPLDFTKEFREMGIPCSRLHDIEYPYGLNQFVDIHCIFPDFDADVDDPDSYNFKPTDDYLNAIINAGSKVFYRLGESIDHYTKPLYIYPPKSAEKWAKICEHIIMHYNEGWADGFNMGIEYWEIWNESDNDRMWLGTPEEFFELYRVTANHLKERFGDKIKVGGYASSGFYVLNREKVSEWLKTLVPYMKDFFKYITAEETKAPMDFFSWHCYADTPEEVALHVKYADDILKEYNITNCENILNEFNMYYCFSEYAPLHKGLFTDIGASIILAQKSNLDMLMHYMFSANSVYNCAFAATGIRRNEVVHLAGYETFKAFNKLYCLGTEVETKGDIEGEINILAAKDENEGAVMIVSRAFEGELELTLRGNYKSYTLKTATDTDGGVANVNVFGESPIVDGKITLNVNKHEILLLSCN